jgi:predicted Rossmann fold flavoprotein
MTAITVGVVGAGPAGIMAALESARNGARVLLFDTNAVVGRKLLVTGNGRCNISNDHAAPGRYICRSADFLAALFAACDQPAVIARLDELGIPTYATADGWRYPLSDSAAAVGDTLAAQLELAGVELHLQTRVADARPDGAGFTLALGGPGRTVHVDRLVVATGGKASPALGSRGDFVLILEMLGHATAPMRPALVPLLADIRPVHKLQGVRLDVGLTLYRGEQVLGAAMGNLLFTDTGLSGPVAMNLSHLVGDDVGRASPLTASIDLLPEHAAALEAILARGSSQGLPLRVSLGAVLPAKVPPVILALAGLPDEVSLAEVGAEQRARVWHLLRDLRLTVTGTRGFAQAQLSTGGVPVMEVDGRTMASRRVPRLYLAGETLDVIGPCGGYNLHFAWASGMLAGAAAARAITA